MKEGFLNSIGDAIGVAALSIEKHAPEIEFWGGLGLMLVGAGIAIYQSIKRVPEIKMETGVMKRELEVRMEDGEVSGEEAEKESRKIVVKTFTNYVKAFALPTALMAAGATSECFGFLGEKARYTAAAAEAATLSAAFAAYRKRNAELIGEEKERALYYGAEVKKVKEKIYDEEGNVVGTETKYQLVQKEETYLDPYTYEWSPETTDQCRENDDMYEFNLTTLTKLQNSWNHIFKDFDTKAVWLVDVLRAIGLENETRVCSRNVGWLNKKFFDVQGDDYIDFRIQPMRYIAPDGREKWKFMLNFNADGEIYEKVKKKVGMMGAIGTELP